MNVLDLMREKWAVDTNKRSPIEVPGVSRENEFPILMRDAGFDVPVDPSIGETFEELSYLERSIGRTGKLAIMPVLRWSSRDLWQLYMLGKR